MSKNMGTNDTTQVARVEGMASAGAGEAREAGAGEVQAAGATGAGAPDMASPSGAGIGPDPNNYLAENTALRRAIGAASDDQLATRFLGRGEHNDNYVFESPANGERLVLRINRVPQPFHKHQMAYEFAALAALEPSGCTPRAVYVDPSAQWYPHGAAVIGWCAGDQLDFDHLRPGDLRCAAQLLASIHAVPAARAEGVLHRPDNPFAELYRECMDRYRPYCSCGLEDARVMRWVERFDARLRPFLEDDTLANAPRCIINTEALPSHFLIPSSSAAEAAANVAASGAFCTQPGYFIDWERPIIGDAAQDLTYFVSPASTFWDSEFFFPAADIEGFLGDYLRVADGRVDLTGFEKRFEAYRLIMALRATTWYTRAIARHGAAARDHMTPKAARKMDTYLSDDFLEMLLTGRS